MENPIMETPVTENPVTEISATGSNILNFKAKTTSPAAGQDTDTLKQASGIAVVTQVKGNMATTVLLHDISYPVSHYLSVMQGITPIINLGDKVLVSVLAGEGGVMIVGVMTPVDAEASASFGMKDGKLVIEAQGAVILKSGRATVELTEAGEIRIDGKDVRTVADSVRTEGKEVRTIAKKKLTLQGSKIDLN